MAVYTIGATIWHERQCLPVDQTMKSPKPASGSRSYSSGHATFASEANVGSK